MEALDSTIIVTALPQMAQSFATSPVNLSLGITAYMLTLAAFIPASGWVADRYGARSVFCAAIGVFTLASALCGFSHNLWQFAGARILQGMGGAMMTPVGRVAMLRSTAKKDLVRAMNFIAVPGLIGPVVGPPVGGFITTYASWRWIFFLNLPIGVLGMTLVACLFANHRSAEKRPFDRVGFLLNGAAVGCLMYGMDLVRGQGTDWLVGSGLVATGLAVGYLAVRHATGHPHPLVDLTALKVRTYAVVNSGGSVFRISIAAPTFLMPLLFQLGLGMSAFASGLLILAHAGGDLAVKAVTTRTLRYFGFRTVLIWSAVLFSLFLLACSFFTASTSHWVIVIVLFLGGSVRSLQMTALSAMQFAEIPSAQVSGAATLSGVVQQLTRGIGVAFAAIVLNLAVALGGNAAQGLTVVDFRVGFVVTAAVALASLLWYVPLAQSTGAAVSGHRPAGAAD